jgi:opacity protein-like surface antigen
MNNSAAVILVLALLGAGNAYAADDYEPDGFEFEVSMHTGGETFGSSSGRKEIQPSSAEGCLPDGEDWRVLNSFTDHPFPHSTTTKGKNVGVQLGVGARAGFRLETHHLVFLHFDYILERWRTRSKTSGWDEENQRSYSYCYTGGANIEVLRMSIGYRFSYPVLDRLEPFAMLEGGVRWYGSSTRWKRLQSEERFTLLLGAGVRFLLRERVFLSLSYLWELPLDWQTTNSIMLGIGAFFGKSS